MSSHPRRGCTADITGLGNVAGGHDHGDGALSSSSTTTLANKSINQQLPKPRQPRIVLSEEEYTSTLESIVQRDYFPDLPGLERQMAVLDRRSQGDATGAIAIRRAARQLQQHEQALADQELLDEQDMADDDGHLPTTTKTTRTTTTRRRPRPLHRETITGFHARVTNEDDEDFNIAQTEEVQAHRTYLEQVFHPTSTTTTATTNSSSSTSANDTPLLEFQMASNQFQPSTFRTEEQKLLQHQPQTLRNGLFFVPTPLHQKQSQQHDQRVEPVQRITNGLSTQEAHHPAIMPPPSTNSTISTTDLVIQQGSSNMPCPSSSSSSLVVLHDTHKNQSIVLAKQDLVEYIPKHSLEKKVQSSQTRFPSSTTSLGRFFAATTTVGNRIVPFLEGGNDDDHDGGTTTDASTDLDTDASSSRMNLAQERHLREGKKQRERTTLVNMTPVIVPGRGGGNDSPVMTWGTVASTPLVLSGQEQQQLLQPLEEETTSKSSFSMPAESTRDKDARKAQEQLERRAKRAKKASNVSSSSSSSSRKGSTGNSSNIRGSSHAREHLLRSLTPAARSLLERTTGSSNRGNSSNNIMHNPSQTRLRPSSRARDAFGSALRGSYGTLAGKNDTQRSSIATSSTTTSTSKHRSRDHAYQATPQVSQFQRATHNATPRK